MPEVQRVPKGAFWTEMWTSDAGWQVSYYAGAICPKPLLFLPPYLNNFCSSHVSHTLQITCAQTYELLKCIRNCLRVRLLVFLNGVLGFEFWGCFDHLRCYFWFIFFLECVTRRRRGQEAVRHPPPTRAHTHTVFEINSIVPKGT